jgi:hypothetical protein
MVYRSWLGLWPLDTALEEKQRVRFSIRTNRSDTDKDVRADLRFWKRVRHLIVPTSTRQRRDRRLG